MEEERISGRQVSVSVVCVSVESAMGVSNDVRNTCFCAVSLTGTMRSAISCATRKNRLGHLLEAFALSSHLLNSEKFL